MKEIVKKLGKLYSLFLSVDTSSKKANVPGIKCYQKCGFKLVDCLYEKRNDGTFSYMVRVKTPPKKRSSSSSTYHRSIKGRTKKGKIKKGRSKYKKNKTKKYKKKKGKSSISEAQMHTNVELTRLEERLKKYYDNIKVQIKTIKEQTQHTNPYDFFMKSKFSDGETIITFDEYNELLEEYRRLGGTKNFSINPIDHFLPKEDRRGGSGGSGGSGGGATGHKKTSMLNMR